MGANRVAHAQLARHSQVAGKEIIGFAQGRQAGRQRPLRVYLIATVALALGFLANQIPALTILLTRHFELLRQVHREALATQPTLTTDPRRYLLGLIFFLILIHALHVVGGLVSLALATARACTAGDPRAMEGPVRFTAIYWHFLGAVWLVLFVTFLAI